MELEVEIARLGAQGDGVADGPEGPIFVPFTLPGERVRIAVEPETDRGDLLDVLMPSPDRIEPVCPHFGICGGCALQHMEEGAYLRWKRNQVIAALRSCGLDAEVEGGEACAPWPRQKRSSAWLPSRSLPRADRHCRLSGPVSPHRGPSAQV